MSLNPRRARRGALLVLTLLLSVVLMMMIGAILKVSSHGRYASSRYSALLAAELAAESGANDALLKLNRDNTWAPTSPHEVTLPGGKAGYRIEFVATPNGDPGRSVNNLKGLAPVQGPRGFDVPAASAYIVVVGFSGDVEKRLEVLMTVAPFYGRVTQAKSFGSREMCLRRPMLSMPSI
jgi:hypothetical protein